jgi:hypothetical protein
MTPEEHQEKFAQVSWNLTQLANQLVADHPEFGKADFGRAFLVTAIALMSDGTSADVTANYLREIAAGIERAAVPDARGRTN